MRPIHIALLLLAIGTIGGYAATRAKAKRFIGPCEPYAEVCRHCSDCSRCRHCSVIKGTCSVCAPKR
jgi:hypothetical protein